MPSKRFQYKTVLSRPVHQTSHSLLKPEIHRRHTTNTLKHNMTITKNVRKLLPIKEWFNAGFKLYATSGGLDGIDVY